MTSTFYPKPDPPPQSDSVAVRSRRLCKHYGDIVALEDLSLEVPFGAFVGLLGPNGSGKTTSMHCLTTLVEPTDGSAWVAGHAIRSAGVAIRRDIGVVFQNPALDPSLTVQETLAFAAAIRGLPRRISHERAEAMLAMFQLEGKRDLRVGTLSGGMRRALDIARSVIHRPRILFLDEPTLGLDVPNRRRIWDHIARLRREEGATVLFTTHYLEEAEGCDTVHFLAGGRIVGSGSPRELIARMGAQMLEIEADDIEATAHALRLELGPGFRQGDRALFRLTSSRGEVASMLRSLPPDLRSVRRRRPTLDDVFVWMTHPELRGELL